LKPNGYFGYFPHHTKMTITSRRRHQRHAADRARAYRRISKARQRDGGHEANNIALDRWQRR
jgi:hypothetical protein